MDDSSAKTTWISITIGVIVGLGIATASACLLHMRILEQVQTRLDLEEFSRRRRARRAKRIAQLCKRQELQREEDEEAEDDHHLMQHAAAAAAAGRQCQADLVTAAADNSRDYPLSSPNIVNETSSNAVNTMPAWLPRVQIHCQGKEAQPSSSSTTPWTCHVPTIPHNVSIIRPTTPKSPVFADMEGSDEEDHVLENEDEQNYIMDEVMGLAGVDSETAAHGSEHADEIVSDGMVRLACGNNLVSSEPTLLRQRLKEDEPTAWAWSPTLEGNAEARPTNDKTLVSKLRSHTIPGDIHSMHKPDPIAADILRKEPEQEQFIRLIVSPTEVPSMEEEEVCKLLQECLAMRAKYLFHETSHPWQSESQQDDAIQAATSRSDADPDPDPFHYAPEAASSAARFQNGGRRHACLFPQRRHDGAIPSARCNNVLHRHAPHSKNHSPRERSNIVPPSLEIIGAEVQPSFDVECGP